MTNTYIAGTGSYLPQKRVSNDDLAEKVDTSDEWIFSRSGIKARRIANEAETASYMGARAAEEALKAANLTPDQIDMILVATCTPDMAFPSTACLIQQKLAIPHVPAFDLQAACSGFIYGLDVANQFIRNGSAKNILLIGTETMTKILDWNDRSTCVLFGDGAGAAILSGREEPGILWTKLGADGNCKDLLYSPNLCLEPYQNRNLEFLQMSGKEVFRVAVKTLEHVANQALEENNLTKGEIDWLIPHQANIRIIEGVAKRLGLSREKVVLTLEEHANTSSASIPLAFDQAVRDGRVKRGQLLLIEAFGAGFTWGAALMRY